MKLTPLYTIRMVAIAGLLSSTQAQTTPPLVLNWSFNDTSGTTAVDSGPYDANGVYQGGFTLNQPGPTANSGTSVALDSGEVYKSPYSALYDLTNNFTVDLWINGSDITTDSGTQRLFSSAGGEWGFGLANNVLQFTEYGIDDYDANEAVIAPDVWTNVAVAVSSTNVASFFVDGNYVQSIQLDGPANENSTVNWFAGSSGEGQYFDGSLNELYVYGSELDQAQISSLAYNNTLSVPEPSNYLLVTCLFGGIVYIVRKAKNRAQRFFAS